MMELDLFGQRISPEVSSKPSNGPQFAKVDEAPMMSRATSQKDAAPNLVSVRGISCFIREGNVTTVWNLPPNPLLLREPFRADLND
jgi:hypothetical protein